jgi:hypothetical protein
MRRHGQNPGEEDAVFLAERAEARCGSRARWGLSNRWLSIENVDARRLSDPDDLALFFFFQLILNILYGVRSNPFRGK